MRVCGFSTTGIYSGTPFHWMAVPGPQVLFCLRNRGRESEREKQTECETESETGGGERERGEIRVGPALMLHVSHTGVSAPLLQGERVRVFLALTFPLAVSGRSWQ